jgi:hypothetical protein
MSKAAWWRAWLDAGIYSTSGYGFITCRGAPKRPGVHSAGQEQSLIIAMLRHGQHEFCWNMRPDMLCCGRCILLDELGWHRVTPSAASCGRYLVGSSPLSLLHITINSVFTTYFQQVQSQVFLIPLRFGTLYRIPGWCGHYTIIDALRTGSYRPPGYNRMWSSGVPPFLDLIFC